MEVGDRGRDGPEGQRQPWMGQEDWTQGICLVMLNGENPEEWRVEQKSENRWYWWSKWERVSSLETEVTKMSLHLLSQKATSSLSHSSTPGQIQIHSQPACSRSPARTAEFKRGHWGQSITFHIVNLRLILFQRASDHYLWGVYSWTLYNPLLRNRFFT